MGDTMVINEERESSSSNRHRNRNSSYRSSLVAASGSASGGGDHSGRQYPLGTAVAYVDEEQLAPMAASPTSSTASSLNFGASLMDAVETAVADNGIELVHHQTRSSLIMTSNSPSANQHHASAANYYLDEKPPSYDDIIGRNY